MLAHTVSKVLTQAIAVGVNWPLKGDMTNEELHELLFGSTEVSPLRRRPDYERVHREMTKSAVTLNLLWQEYCEECRRAGEIFVMYTQFCLYYREFAQNTTAMMHIDRKSGDQMEVDWAGQTAYHIDTDWLEFIEARHKKASTIFSSQFAPAGWPAKIGVAPPC